MTKIDLKTGALMALLLIFVVVFECVKIEFTRYAIKNLYVPAVKEIIKEVRASEHEFFCDCSLCGLCDNNDFIYQDAEITGTQIKPQYSFLTGKEVNQGENNGVRN